ncbi:cytochrome P450 [Anabaena cylindrica FACHB-243]|uniref:Peroxidase n=1 Tax=Anabaena cylindrica (strain ATCC 27899 / PCC 7122) TaxID=272123 RepID=K9ZJ24_ANACC|nr:MULTISPECIES: cytochrome P450 [Anabaena]AFZ58759.1 Peroxidase [Anabaena cylindrica PCC 7122]MBD2420101.1 cytochrome P450 [Anabaena cylindrica FACHB-243]MBY5285386.1 cytochrome P450 [Anabaena sp. CCAP 1446/1C]MBY5306573.1 cytochrome P450 [Anabaena sp. CCAP 1446/1C]MCM2407002.1 cytochrome P450 [Anabaena sp. CCAP 1446/1C]
MLTEILQQGEKYDLLNPLFFANPDATLHQMRTEDPIYWHSQLESWILTRYVDIYNVIRDPRFSVDRGGKIGKSKSLAVKTKLDFCNQYFTQWMVFSDPPRHTRLRNLVGKAFTPQLIESLHPLIQNFADELIDAIQDSGKMEVIHDFAVPLPALVTAKLLGVPQEDIPLLKRWSSNMFMLFGAGWASEEVVETTYQSLVDSIQYFDALIAEYRQSPSDNLINQLIAAEDHGSVLSDEELTATCITFMAGAYETTTYLISNGLLALLQNPEQLQMLQENPLLIDSTVEEILRYCGPAFSVVRRAIADIEINGQLITNGQKIYCVLHAANHDPAKFPNPDKFEITRKENRHLGLGQGIHVCLGAALTRLETKIAINTILQRLQNIRLDTEQLTWIPNLAMRGLEELPIVFSLKGIPNKKIFN